MMHVSLIVPAPFDMVSGGYGYDRRIVAEMRALGHTVDVLELTGSFPLADKIAHASAAAAWNKIPPSSRPVIDGLALPAFLDKRDLIQARRATGLIHHPVSLETGLDLAHQRTLAEMERELFHCLARLIVTSGTTAKTLTEEFAIPPNRIRNVVPGTDDAPRCSGSGGPSCEIISIGTLIPRKGHDVLLRALAALPDQDWHLTIVGAADRDPTHAGELIALAGQLGIKRRVTFAGEQVGAALDAIWRGADLFVLATHYEGYGMAIAEALKRGLPVIVTAGGAAGQLITQGCGIVCPPADHNHLAGALRQMISDGGRRSEMAEQAWRAGQNLPSWQSQARLFAAALI